jgi:hypothetical protein
MNDAQTDFKNFFKQLTELEDFGEGDIKELEQFLQSDKVLEIDEEKVLASPPVALKGASLESLIKLEKEHASDEEIADLRTRIGLMKLPGRVILAMFGNAACRGLLVNDGNRMVQLAVLKNPKIRPEEIELFTKSRTVCETFLRIISENKVWMKSASLKYNLVTNPKTAQDVSMRWLRFLGSHELKKVAKSRDVPQLIAITAKRRLADEPK